MESYGIPATMFSITRREKCGKTRENVPLCRFHALKSNRIKSIPFDNAEEWGVIKTIQP